MQCRVSRPARRDDPERPFRLCAARVGFDSEVDTFAILALRDGGSLSVFFVSRFVWGIFFFFVFHGVS